MVPNQTSASNIPTLLFRLSPFHPFMCVQCVRATAPKIPLQKGLCGLFFMSGLPISSDSWRWNAWL